MPPSPPSPPSPIPFASHRRRFLQAAAATVAASSLQAAAREPARLSLGFSLYGMRSLPLAKACAACAEIGYESIELPVMQGWPADSARFDAKRQAALRRQLKDHDLRLNAIMENLPIFGDASAHRRNLDRLKAAAAIGHSLSDKPILETILGGRPSQWPEVRGVMAKRLEDWARVAEQERLTIAIKAHVGGAMHLPEHPIELLDKTKSPYLKSAYDFSHFRLRDVDLEESVETMASQTVFVHVKDAAGDASKVQFLLPGEGDIDYVKLFQVLVKHGYRGDIVVEVSGQIHGKPGYDPLAAAKQSYKPLAQALQAI